MRGVLAGLLVALPLWFVIIACVVILVQGVTR